MKLVATSMCRLVVPGIVNLVWLRLIVDDNAGFRDEVRALLEEKAGISGSRGIRP